jgi:putative endopeptidase
MKSPHFKTLILITSISLVISSCGDAKKQDQNREAKSEISHGIILENMDTLVSPKEDFYNYVNGNWVKNNTVHASAY